MPPACPRCQKDSANLTPCPKSVRDGSFYRTSDGQWIERYRCRRCAHRYSSATFQCAYRQKKRHKNETIRKLYASNMSLRRIAIVLRLHRTTVVRKFLFLGKEAEERFYRLNQERGLAMEFEFDDLETFEHTKCKPLSVTLAVEFKTRRILGLEVSTMKAKGKLVGKAKRYGERKDTRKDARRALFERLVGMTSETCLIKSDQNPYYEKDVREFFPKATYHQYKGQRGSLGGQGELKKIKFDPLFSLNHTCAMLRANVNRLIRKTWNTTKRQDRLRAHLFLYAEFHNRVLIT